MKLKIFIFNLTLITYIRKQFMTKKWYKIDDKYIDYKKEKQYYFNVTNNIEPSKWIKFLHENKYKIEYKIITK